MRRNSEGARGLRAIVLALGALVAVAGVQVAVGDVPVATAQGAAQGDARAKAKGHYLAGRQLYDAGDYKGAIKEFTAADQLAPSGVNDFNIALCQEKLGDHAGAIKAYRGYLARTPDAPNKASVEATIASLETKLKADDAARAEEARKAAEAEAAKAEAARAEEAARAAEEAARRPAPPAEVAPPVETRPAGPAATGDPELDRVAGIDVNAIRDERGGGGAAVGAVGAEPGGPAAPAPVAPQPPEKKASKPIYKQWWFWVVAGVSAYVLYSVISDSNDDDNRSRALMQPIAPAPTGATLLRW